MNEFNLCFIHVEKAGGTTFNDLLLSCLPGYWIMPPRSGTRGFRYEARCLSRLRKLMRFDHIGGHQLAAFANYESVFPHPFYVSFVRDPVKRYLSHANWLAAMKRQSSAQIDDYLANTGMRNIECYRICGTREFAPAQELIEQKQYFIGVSERFDESVFLLQRVLGLEFPRLERSNVTRDSNRKFDLYRLDRHSLDRVEEANAEDLKLYEWVTNELYPAQQRRADWSDEEYQSFLATKAVLKLNRRFYAKKKLKNAVSRLTSKLALPRAA